MATINISRATLTLTAFNTTVLRTNIVWPSDLPAYFLDRTYNEKKNSNVLRSSVDVGLPQTRRRYSEPIKNINGVMRMTQDQLDSFELWFDEILKGGTQKFLMTNPLNSEVRSMKFREDYSVSHEGGVYYKVSMPIEVHP